MKTLKSLTNSNLKFCEMFFDLKKSTPYIMVYGEIGITPLNLSTLSRI